jgi:hypothetical protein
LAESPVPGETPDDQGGVLGAERKSTRQPTIARNNGQHLTDELVRARFYSPRARKERSDFSHLEGV